MSALLRWVKHFTEGAGSLHRMGELRAESAYLRREMVRLAAAERRAAWVERRRVVKSNDRLTFEEIHDLLTELGFAGISRTVEARNHHIVAERPSV